MFHTIFVVLTAVFMTGRMWFHIRARSWKREQQHAEGVAMRTARIVLGYPMLIGTAIYIFRPQWLRWAAFPLPDSVRWAGVVIAASGCLLCLWTHYALAGNFSPTLRIREAQTLVRGGPYRWVRHPMYTAFVLLFSGLLLLSAMWFPAFGLALMFVLMHYRTPREEQMMLDAFGEEYRRYMASAPRYLPW